MPFSNYFLCVDNLVTFTLKLNTALFHILQVCRASKQFLKLMESKAVIRINGINPMLFSFVEELNEVKVNTCMLSLININVTEY